MFLELETGPYQNEDEHRTFKTLFLSITFIVGNPLYVINEAYIGKTGRQSQIASENIS